MAEEFQGGICGGNLWSSSRSVLMAPSPCSVGLNHDVAGFGWPGHDLIVDIKARSSSGDTNSVCESTCGFQDVLQKPPHQSHNNFNSVSGSGTALNIDSTLQMMGFGLSTSPTSDLNQANNFVSTTRRAESNNIYSMLQEDNMQGGNKLSYRQEIGLLDSSNYQIQKDFSSNGGTVATTSQALSAGFPVSSASYGYGNPETLLQSLFDGEQHSFSNSNNNRSMDYNSSPTPNYGSNLGNNNMMSSSWPRFSAPNKQLQQPHGGLHFSNNTPFWNATAAEAAGPNDNNSILRAGLFPSVLPQQLQYATPTMFEEKPKCNNVLTTKPINVSNEDVQDSGSVEKRSSTTNGNDNHHNPPVLKRARIETPSPLPTFKVRKEKLGDRITALQQLVSPFGKTDTASVLQEAIDYIRFLHDQVSVLSTPYMKNGASVQVQQQGSTKVPKDQEVSRKQDLKSRGLCLVPISSTFPVANETTADFWTPTFGGTFR